MRRGFTLIELLVVLAVVGLLITIAAPRTIDHVERARETTLKASLRELRRAIDQFEADTGALPRTLDELVTRRYLHAVPVDPLTGSRGTWRLVSAAEARPTADGAAPPLEPAVDGVADVRSGAAGRARDGSAFADW
jgi:prepilin-type N-terminal cleavage/methylation domain-containing protein